MQDICGDHGSKPMPGVKVGAAVGQSVGWAFCTLLPLTPRPGCLAPKPHSPATMLAQVPELPPQLMDPAFMNATVSRHWCSRLVETCT